MIAILTGNAIILLTGFIIETSPEAEETRNPGICAALAFGLFGLGFWLLGLGIFEVIASRP